MADASPSIKSPTTSEESSGGRIDLDVHELGAAFKLDTLGVDSRVLAVHSTLPQDFYSGPSLQISYTSDYPKQAPTLTLVAGLRELLKDVPPLTGKMDSTTGLIDIGTILGRPWEEDDTFVDIMNLITVLLERARHHKVSPATPFLRDYGYPVTSPYHYGRYDLLADRPLKKVKAVYDFEAQDETELQFNVDDIIEILYERKDGWVLPYLTSNIERFKQCIAGGHDERAKWASASKPHRVATVTRVIP